jgi:dolichol-phosphate mannosyltransferase
VNPKSLSIIVPVYNEELTVVSVMKKLMQTFPDAQIIYVDDGSKDGSLALLKSNARPQDKVVTKFNGGKGSAIREGLLYAEGSYTVIQDADLEYEPSEIHELLKTAQNENREVVFGSRFLKKNPNIYKRFLLGNKAITLCVNLLFFSRLTDSYTCYKLLKTDLFKSLDIRANGFDMEAEICCKCLKRGIRIKEIPISYNPRTIEEGKKICLADAFKGVWMMVKIRLGIKH